MNFKPYESLEEAREALRRWAIKASGGCMLQEGRDGKEWPCGTCFCSIMGQLLDEPCGGPESEEYHKHNEPVDRINEVWRAILQIRDAEYLEEK